jgi:hypothetical protein
MRFELPARYFPITRGLYEVAPGLKPLGTDFGNGTLDARVFQIDSEFPRFRRNKMVCRQERLGKYFQQAHLTPEVEAALVAWMINRLTTEYPGTFVNDAKQILCRHTGEEISLNDRFELLPDSKLGVKYHSAFDALANQVAEDICLVKLDGSRNWLAAAHLCSPSHWAVEDKIGKSFAAIHDPVPGIGAINRNSAQLVEAMIHRGPFVRFVWGIGTDDRLNHHPQSPAGVDPAEWKGRCFDPQNPELFLRVERQVIWGLPAVGAAAFVIRVSHLQGDLIRSNPAERDQLISALNSMSLESRRYKGVESTVEAMVAWLNAVR